jgi:hypothetical protein
MEFELASTMDVVHYNSICHLAKFGNFWRKETAAFVFY